MILKYFESKKINLKKQKMILLYGNNQGHKEQVLEEDLKPIFPKNIFNYDESEILKDIESFKETIFNKSFFENEKLIIINRVSERILNIIEPLLKNILDETYIVLLAGNLDKKSKIRKLFEKEVQTICIPFYEDTDQTLNAFAQKFIRKRNINISQQILNIIIERARGDRINLKNELEKIENFMLNKKKLLIEDVLKLSNLSTNYEIGDLIDSCLSKNKRRIINILNENNFSNEDSVTISRVFLNKAKKILILSQKYELSKNIDLTISSAKPAIFWKEKEMVKQQIYIWPPQKLKEIIYKLNNIELHIKRNLNNSINLITDFILDTSSPETNN
tara:strand:+ start:8034 stop:9032 length:999 start_codon:yes stop_codon:yes gene_type:complete